MFPIQGRISLGVTAARKLAGLSSRPKLRQPGETYLSFREATQLAKDGYDHLETSELALLST